MTNFEELVALLVFIPCLFCVLAGALSMASYRCACCCPNSNSSSRRRCTAHQVLPMSVFRLTEHSYRRLTSSNSSTIINQNSSAGRSYADEESSQVVTDFDYRQSLHMECGVVALEPPPSYTVAMEGLHQQIQGGSTSEEEGETDERPSQNHAALLRMNSGNDREFPPPPPYDESDRGRRSRVNGRVRVGLHRNNEVIQLRVLPVSESHRSSMDESDASHWIVAIQKAIYHAKLSNTHTLNKNRSW